MSDQLGAEAISDNEPVTLVNTQPAGATERVPDLGAVDALDQLQVHAVATHHPDSPSSDSPRSTLRSGRQQFLKLTNGVNYAALATLKWDLVVWRPHQCQQMGSAVWTGHDLRCLSLRRTFDCDQAPSFQPISRVCITTGVMYVGHIQASSDSHSTLSLIAGLMDVYDWHIFLGTHGEITTLFVLLFNSSRLDVPGYNADISAEDMHDCVVSYLSDQAKTQVLLPLIPRHLKKRENEPSRCPNSKKARYVPIAPG